MTDKKLERIRFSPEERAQERNWKPTVKPKAFPTLKDADNASWYKFPEDAPVSNIRRDSDLPFDTWMD